MCLTMKEKTQMLWVAVLLMGILLLLIVKHAENLKNMKKTLLWLDDFRNPINFIDTEQYDVIWVKSYYYFVKYFEEEQVMPDVLWFDHDLGENEFCETAPDGYDCAKYLINWCEKTGTPMANEIYSQSNNPAGKERILGLLNNYKNFKANE